MSKVGLCGDWHGNTRWAVSVIEALASQGIKEIWHVGDFGIWPGSEGKLYLNHVMKTCEGLGVRILVTPGNHEDYTQIVDPEGPVGEKQVLGSGDDWEVSILPRGYRWEADGGMTVVSLGGAPSIDFDMRKPGRSWWPEEAIRESDLDRLVETEVMIAHDSPGWGTAKVQQIIGGDSPFSWSDEGLAYAAEGRVMMERAFDIVKPKFFVHGHYHVYDVRTDEERGCVFLSLDSDGVRSNVRIFDTETAEVFPL